MADGMTSNRFAAATDGTTLPQDKPTLRADQVGSLLRPQDLKDARAQHEAARLSAAQLREVEDRCILKAARLQENAGLHAISDGDFRRSAFHVDFLTSLEGWCGDDGSFPMRFRAWRRITHRSCSRSPARSGTRATSLSMPFSFSNPRPAASPRSRCPRRVSYTRAADATLSTEPRIPISRNSMTTSRRHFAPRSWRWDMPDAVTCSSTKCITRSFAIPSWLPCSPRAATVRRHSPSITPG